MIDLKPIIKYKINDRFNVTPDERYDKLKEILHSWLHKLEDSNEFNEVILSLLESDNIDNFIIAEQMLITKYGNY